MTSTLTAALVGDGTIAVNHVRAMALTHDVVVTVLVDPSSEARRALASAIQAETDWGQPRQYASLEQMLSDGQRPDVVVITTPSGSHAQLALTAIHAGAHVIIEKPIDTVVSKTRELSAAAGEAADHGQIVSVISQHRFDPASQAVASAAHNGSFGRLTTAVATVPWWRSQGYYDSGDWRGTWELDGGGAAMNQGVHTVDLLVWLLGEPVSVFAHAATLAHTRIEVEDSLVATLRFSSGALAVFHATTSAFPGSSVRVDLYGDHGSATIEADRLKYFYAEPPQGISPEVLGDTHVDPTRKGPQNQADQIVSPDQVLGAPVPDDEFARGHARQYKDIVEAIRTGRSPAVTVEDAALSLAVVQSFYVSARLQREVAVRDVLSGAYDEVAFDRAGRP